MHKLIAIDMLTNIYILTCHERVRDAMKGHLMYINEYEMRMDTGHIVSTLVLLPTNREKNAHLNYMYSFHS